MAEAYEYRVAGRRPMVWLAAGAILAFVAIAAVEGAPWYIWAAVAIPVSMVVYAIVVNPVTRFRLDDEALTHGTVARPERIPLDQIAGVRVIRFTDGDWVEITCADGRRVELADSELPPTDVLTAELDRRGIAWTES